MARNCRKQTVLWLFPGFGSGPLFGSQPSGRAVDFLCPRGSRSSIRFLVGVTLMGTALVPYARARAESMIPRCNVGILERPERILLLFLGGHPADHAGDPVDSGDFHQRDGRSAGPVYAAVPGKGWNGRSKEEDEPKKRFIRDLWEPGQLLNPYKREQLGKRQIWELREKEKERIYNSRSQSRFPGRGRPKPENAEGRGEKELRDEKEQRTGRSLLAGNRFFFFYFLSEHIRSSPFGGSSGSRHPKNREGSSSGQADH